MTLRPLLRRPGVIALSILLLLAAGLAFFWWIAQARLMATLATEAAALRSQGWQIDYQVGATSGFPLTVETEVTDVRLLRPSPRGEIVWQAESLTLVWSPLRPATTTAHLPTESLLRLTSGEKSLSGRLHVAGGEVRITGPRSGGRVALALDRPSLSIDHPQPLILRAEGLTLDLHDLGTHGRDHLAATVQGRVTLDRLTAPQMTPLLAEPLSITAGLTVMGDPPAVFMAPALAEWRDRGGTIEVRPLSLALGGFALEGEGTVTLDRLMRPLAAGTAKVRGFVEGIDRLIAVGLVTERDGRLARLLLSAVATADPQTGQPSLSVPITVQDGWLLLGPSRLVPVAPLPFPDPT